MLVPGIDSKRMRPFLQMSTTNSSVAALTIPIAPTRAVAAVAAVAASAAPFHAVRKIVGI